MNKSKEKFKMIKKIMMPSYLDSVFKLTVCLNPRPHSSLLIIEAISVALGTL